MTDAESDADEALDRLLRAARPTSTPRPEITRQQRAQLLEATHITSADRSRSGPRRRYAAVAAAVVVLAGGAAVVARGLDDPAGTEIMAGPDPTTDETPSTLDGPLTSAACEGRPLPFDVPVGDGFLGPVVGPAPGSPGPDVEGQLIASWLSSGTSVEVRWPADVFEDTLTGIDLTRDDLERQVGDGVAASSFAASDLSIEVTEELDGAIGHGVSYTTSPALDGTYAITVARYQRIQQSSSAPVRSLRPIWGDGMCSTVQIVVRALDGRSDVRDRARPLHDALMAPGGPILPPADDTALVVERTEAETLAPASPCQVPVGVSQDPIRSEAIDGPGPFPTPDEALAAYLETTVQTHEGPFGPVESYGAARTGYTAISLPDGRVAYQMPDPGSGVVGYYFAEQDADGWSITWTEGPSC